MGRSLRSWDKGAEWCCSTPLPRCRRRSPPLTPTPQCGEPGEPGTRGRRASQRKPPWDRGGRARPSAPPNPGRLSPTIPAAENRSSPVEGAAAGLGSGGAGRTSALTSRRVAERPTTCTGLRGGVCNSLKSCTEPDPAQPQRSSSRRRRNEAFRGAGRGQGDKRAVS